MSAEAWATTQSPLFMLHLLRGCPGGWDERKACLVAGRCLLRALAGTTDRPTPRFADAVERLTGPGDREELLRAWAELYEEARRHCPVGSLRPYWGFDRDSERPSRVSLRTVFRETSVLEMGATEVAPAELQCRLLREVFGNPFRPVRLDPAWRTADVRALAEGMYARGDFGAMPILADALQEAGCESEDILSHCREVGREHVRGCWVIDLLLGK